MARTVKCKGCGETLYIGDSLKCIICGHTTSTWKVAGAHAYATDRQAHEAKARHDGDRAELLKWRTQPNTVRTSITDEEIRESEGPDASSSASALHGMTWQEAEQLACNWMRENGFPDASVTPGGADGGIDVVSSGGLAQVKHHTKPVGIAEMQRISGIASSTGKVAVFFAASGYTSKAIEWANAHNIECYTYPVVKRVRL